jgi:hypothetical protein
MIIFIPIPKNVDIPAEDILKFISLCFFMIGFTIISVMVFFHYFPTEIQVKNQQFQEKIEHDRIERENRHQELIKKYGKDIWKRP